MMMMTDEDALHKCENGESQQIEIQLETDLNHSQSQEEDERSISHHPSSSGALSSVYVFLDDIDEAPPPTTASTTTATVAVTARTKNTNSNTKNNAKKAASSERHIMVELIRYTRRRNWKKKVLTVVLLVCSACVFYDLFFGNRIRTFLTNALEWMTLNPFGAVFSFILFFMVATLLFVPPVLLMFGAGYAFTNSLGSFICGLLAATAVSFFGLSLGAMAAFLRSRYMMRDLIELFSRRYPIVKALDQALERKGFRVMLLLRLCPIIPFNGLNYIGGITAVSIENFTKALIGILPNICFWTFCGASADRIMMQRQEQLKQFKNDEDSSSPQQQLCWLILLSIGVACGVIAAICIWRFAVQELQKEIDRDSAETWFRYTKQKHQQPQSTSFLEQYCDDGSTSSRTKASPPTSAMSIMTTTTKNSQILSPVSIQGQHDSSIIETIRLESSEKEITAEGRTRRTSLTSLIGRSSFSSSSSSSLSKALQKLGLVVRPGSERSASVGSVRTATTTGAASTSPADSGSSSDYYYYREDDDGMEVMRVVQESKGRNQAGEGGGTRRSSLKRLLGLSSSSSSSSSSKSLQHLGDVVVPVSERTTSTVSTTVAAAADSASSSDYYCYGEDDDGMEVMIGGQEKVMAQQDYRDDQQQEQQRHAGTHGILTLLGLEVAHYDEPEDGLDEEWFWLWT